MGAGRGSGLPTGSGPVRARLVLVVPAALLLVLGLAAGLVLLGVPVPTVGERMPDLHAPLLVFGFVGALVSLERAVALDAGWAYAAPALLATGALTTLSPAPLLIGQAIVTAGLLLHAGQYLAIWRRQAMTATAVQALGAVVAVAAAVAWCGGVPPSRLVPQLACFLILTIAGERLELARVGGPGEAAQRALFALSLAFATAALVTVAIAEITVPAAGALLIVLVAALVRVDVARATINATGLPRYIAVCVLTGYAWLAAAGAGWLLGGARTEGPVYDATTHAIFVGFVITMIMAHAPLVLPAVLRVRIAYHPALSAPVALLQLALLVRVVAGDAWAVPGALVTGGVLGVAAIVLFAATAVAVSVRRGTASAPPATPPSPEPPSPEPPTTGPPRPGPPPRESTDRVAP
ncbi:hypothetical protein [Microbacterium sp. No. 7]|uniref:hypothetical protein n=1 Tax=Microbacterium sp. No. 7 TaxID=1714373 RepID=UPI0006ECD0D6|nr:hypothetical protein [Microbacterium sp. No. 7]ALJ22223.1 hypothetical protein AOA12_20995 [Microbacterium sp. No. 7]